MKQNELNPSSSCLRENPRTDLMSMPGLGEVQLRRFHHQTTSNKPRPKLNPRDRGWGKGRQASHQGRLDSVGPGRPEEVGTQGDDFQIEAREESGYSLLSLEVCRRRENWRCFFLSSPHSDITQNWKQGCSISPGDSMVFMINTVYDFVRIIQNVKTHTYTHTHTHTQTKGVES